LTIYPELGDYREIAAEILGVTPNEIAEWLEERTAAAA